MINRQSFQRYWRARFRRLKGTPNSIALGIACGVAVSFTPFVGAHLMLAMLVAWMMRGNGNRGRESLDVSVYLGVGILYRAQNLGA